MKATIVLLVALLVAPSALAQRDHRSAPFTRDETQLISAVWPKIREAARFEDVDWRAVGLARAPGDGAAQDLMEERWGTLRQAGSFEDIDWDAEYRALGRSNDGYRSGYRDSAGPFSPEEADAMRKVWPAIRDADDFANIDWRAVGLRRAPGDSTARSVMASNWGALKEAATFDDIDWRATAGYRTR